MKVLGNDVIINQCVAGGQFELNHNLPLIAFSMLESLEMLINANKIFKERCIDGITANEEEIKRKVENSYATLNALLPEFGYNRLTEIAKDLQKTTKNNDFSVKEFLIKGKYLSEERFNELTSPEAILALGQG